MAGLNNDATPFPISTRVSPAYIQLVPGLQGPAGQNAVTTTTTANYTQPAVGSTVTISVTSTAAMAAGLDVFVNTGGYYAVTNVVDATHVTIQNTGASGNASPGNNVALGNLVVPAGPAGNLTVQSNGAAITQRPILDIEGLTYSDDVPGNRMKFVQSNFALAAPGATQGGIFTIGPTDFWKKFQAVAGGYQITVGAIQAGFLYRLQNMPGVGTTLEQLVAAATPITLFRGANTFTIEDPQNRFAATANTVTLGVSESIYEFMLDSTDNVLRCMRQVQ